jgi:hypothetical protein
MCKVCNDGTCTMCKAERAAPPKPRSVVRPPDDRKAEAQEARP